MTARILWTYEDYAALPENGLSPSTAAIDRGRKRRLYARYGVPYLWFVDPIARDVEVLSLAAGEYTVVARVSGEQPVDLPPFTDLGLVPASLWPDESRLGSSRSRSKTARAKRDGGRH